MLSTVNVFVIKRVNEKSKFVGQSTRGNNNKNGGSWQSK